MSWPSCRMHARAEGTTGLLRGTVLLAGSREDFFASEHPLVRGFFHLKEAGDVQG